MQEEINVDLIREFDPNALGIMVEGQAGYQIIKRAFDLCLAILLLILLSPLMVLITILIKLNSPGPAIFVQERVGSRRRTQGNISYWKQTTFKCYKFRTMHCNADQSLHQAYFKALINNDCEGMAALQGGDTQIRKMTNDPRITRFGRILRKSSLDELPQLFNVIKGEMSLVGPRPAIPYEVEMYKPWHRKRLETKPGMTGLWQVTSRSRVDFDEIIRLDIQYIKQQSFWLDLKILLKTPFVVISCKGAV